MKNTINIIINVVILSAVCLVVMTMLVLFISSWRNVNKWVVSDIDGDEPDLEEGNMDIFGNTQHKKIE